MTPESADGLWGPGKEWRSALYSKYIDYCNPPKISLFIKIVRSEPSPLGEGILQVNWIRVRTMITTL